MSKSLMISTWLLMLKNNLAVCVLALDMIGIVKKNNYKRYGRDALMKLGILEHL